MLTNGPDVDLHEAKRLANRAAVDYADAWSQASSARLSPTLYHAKPVYRGDRFDPETAALIRSTMALVSYEIGESAMTNTIDFEAGAIELLADYVAPCEAVAPYDLDSLGRGLKYALEDFKESTEEPDEKTATTLSRMLVELSVALHEAEQDAQLD